MKNIILILFATGLALPLGAATINTTTTTITVGGNAVAASVSPARTPGYYRLAFDAASKRIKALVFSVGITETISGLYCAETYAEIQAYVIAHELTGLPVDPNGGR